MRRFGVVSLLAGVVSFLSVCSSEAGPIVVGPGTGVVARADLRVSSISVGISTNIGTSFVMRASVTVRNASTRPVATGSYLDVWYDSATAAACGDVGDATSSIGALAGLSARTFTYTFSASSGTYTFQAFADSQCTVTESNETNNQNTATYTVP